MGRGRCAGGVARSTLHRLCIPRQMTRRRMWSLGGAGRRRYPRSPAHLAGCFARMRAGYGEDGRANALAAPRANGTCDRGHHHRPVGRAWGVLLAPPRSIRGRWSGHAGAGSIRAGCSKRIRTPVFATSRIVSRSIASEVSRRTHGPAACPAPPPVAPSDHSLISMQRIGSSGSQGRLAESAAGCARAPSPFWAP